MAQSIMGNIVSTAPQAPTKGTRLEDRGVAEDAVGPCGPAAFHPVGGYRDFPEVCGRGAGFMCAPWEVT